MLVVHGAWSHGGLYLWAEDPDAYGSARGGRIPKPHPYAVPGADLERVLASLPAVADGGPAGDGGGPAELVLLLPGTSARPEPSPDLVVERAPSRGKRRLVPWRVPALRLDAPHARAFLASLDGPGAAERTGPDTDADTAGDGEADADGDAEHGELGGDVLVGAELRYLTVLAEDAAGLVRRGRMLPALVHDGETAYARWRCVLTGADADRARTLATALPPVLRAIPTPGTVTPAGGARPPAGGGAPGGQDLGGTAAAWAGGAGPPAGGGAAGGSGSDGGAVAGGASPGTGAPGAGEIVVEVLDAFADAEVRARVAGPLGPASHGGRATFAQRWARALTGPDGLVEGDDIGSAEAAALAGELDAWRAAAHAGDGPIRTFFRLVEPELTLDDLACPDPGTERDGEPAGGGVAEPAEEAAGDAEGVWEVRIGVQAADDPSLVASADAVWRADPDELGGFLAGHAEQTLLSGLGRAARLYPELNEALRAAAPSGIRTDASGAYRFLKETAPLLSAAGFGVRLPRWAGTTRLGRRLTATSHASAQQATVAQGFGRKELVGFRWDLALGDTVIDEEELLRLAALKVPLVRLRGQWVELDDRQLDAALNFLKRRREGEMTVSDALAITLLDDPDDDLPITDVKADGPLADLLSGEPDRHLAPVPTPDGLNGELRPYQQRGLAWLDFMSDLGLGTVLADDMGLGKCLTPNAAIYVDGKLTTAERLWDENSGTTFPDHDGEGEWSIPTKRLRVNALRGGLGGSMCQARVSTLYRQWINEPVRRIHLDDGSSVTITRRHRLLGPSGWTNAIVPGDRVCVPGRLVWHGDPVDPALTRLLAWQIAEGHESTYGNFSITQKNPGTLNGIMTDVTTTFTRLGFTFRQPRLTPPDQKHPVWTLSSYSSQYRAFLEARGYTWGMESKDKRIPDFIMAADKATNRTFLREYFSAEGSVGEGTRLVEISSASVWLMDQLVHMLRRFGIWMRVHTSEKCATNGTGIYRPYSVGTIGGPSLRRFHRLIGFSDPTKQEKLDRVCVILPNTNVEGVPGSDLPTRAHTRTRIPARHFGVGTAYFSGAQELSKKTARAAVRGFDGILSGAREAEYLKEPRSRWTDQVLAAYDDLDRRALAGIRDELSERVTRDVFYARVTAVEEFTHEGWVYDLEVAEHHNFVAGGMLCHNTVQTLGLVQTDVNRGAEKPTLLVCPMSLVGNWQREAERFTPGLRVYVHHGAKRVHGEALAQAVDGADLVITTYGTVLRDQEELAGYGWRRVAVDEAQAIKNARSRQARAVRGLSAGHRLALTGTPVENHLTELWSIMEFANPGLLGSAAGFRKRFAKPIEADGDAEAAGLLRRATGPFVLRRLKTDRSIITDLPEKQEIKVWCNLTPEQASLYQATVDDMMARLENSEGIEYRGLVLATMAKLKQVCNHPAHLLKDGSRLAGRSGKLARLEEIVDEVLADGDKALCFTQYAEFGAALQPYLAARTGRPVLFLHGGLGKRQRDEMVARFSDGDEPAIFLLSLKAGGTGLNLTAAGHVIHVDRWWNPAVEDQATDRAFRIGQHRNVQVRKFICVGTLEERIDEMIERKKELAERIVGTGEDWLTSLSTGELRDVIRLAPEAVGS